MAKKENLFSEEIDLTSFDWVTAGSNSAVGKPGCGGCHPGGGGLELDRSGKRYDLQLQKNPRLAETLDGDYYKSRWNETGVIEADCLICHQAGYYFKKRIDSLAQLNFQWAIVAGSGVGQIVGSVKEGQQPKVVYNTRFFNDDGKIVLALEPHPSSENCLFCHAPADMIKRGFSWDDHHNHDIHNASGIGCVSCHPGNKEHQLAKGDENLSTVRDDLDNTMLNCSQCHESGYMGAPTPQHEKVRPNHLQKLACEVCHIPQLGRSSALGLDVSTGRVHLYPRLGAEKVGSPLQWLPEMHLGGDGKLHPVSLFQPNLYTNRSVKGIHYPLFAHEINEAYTTASSTFRQDVTFQPLINSSEEVQAMLRALQLTLAGNRRFDQVEPCYHSGGLLYSLDNEGKIVTENDTTWAAEINAFNINHNVAPISRALGADGCGDCHSGRTNIIAEWLSVRDGDADNAAKRPPGFFDHLQLRMRIFYLDWLHKYNFSKYLLIPLLLLTSFTVVLFREGRLEQENSVIPELENYTPVLLSVMVWLLLLRNLAFLVLACSGAIFFFNKITLIKVFFVAPGSAEIVHWSSGVIFLGAISGCVLLRRRLVEKTSDNICHLDVYGGKVLVLLLACSGICMIWRQHLSWELMYLSSIIHSLAAFILIAVFAAKNYHRLMRRTFRQAGTSPEKEENIDRHIHNRE